MKSAELKTSDMVVGKMYRIKLGGGRSQMSILHAGKEFTCIDISGLEYSYAYVRSNLPHCGGIWIHEIELYIEPLTYETVYETV